MKSKSEILVFNGVKFYRYPNAKKHSHRPYFLSSKSKRLHRAIWEFHNGPIPKNHDIHHIDGNPLNNSIENLDCIDSSEHRRMHYKPQEPGSAWKRIKIKIFTCGICNRKFKARRKTAQPICCSQKCFRVKYKNVK